MTRPLRFAIYALIAGCSIVSPYLGIPEWTPSLATISLFSAISLMGLNLIFGYCGLLVLGQAAFAAVAGYAFMLIFNAGMPGLLSMALGFLLAVILARILAGIFIRLPGIYLAIGTLGFAYVAEGAARAYPGLTGGASGLVLRSQARLSDDGWYLVAVTGLLVALVSMWWLLRGPTTRALQLLRQDELAAETAGLDVARLKARLFTIGAAFTAAGGIAMSQYVGVVSPEMGGASMSLEYLAMVIIGGAGNLFGPVLGSVLIHWLFALSGAAQEYELLVYGLGFFLMVLFAPRGVAGLLTSLLARIGWTGAHGASPQASTIESVTDATTDVAAERVNLIASNVTKRFGGLTAVKGVSVEVRPGEVLGLLGPNGAGKSTFFNVLSGIETLDDGTIKLGERDISKLSINRRSRIIGRSFQVPRLMTEMTVLRNVLVRVDQLYPLANESDRVAIAMKQLSHFDLHHLAQMPAREIAIGLHKLIDIARASIGNLPVVLLDEPGVGLAPEELERLKSIIAKMKASGSAVIIVEHNIDFILSVCDRILVMEGGAPIALGTPDEVMGDEHVQRAYLGTFA